MLKGQKHPCRCREETWGEIKHASSTSFVALKWLSLFSVLSFSLGERGSALRVLHRNHGAHNNRRKPVPWVPWGGERGIQRRRGMGSRGKQKDSKGQRSISHIENMKFELTQIKEQNPHLQMTCCIPDSISHTHTRTKWHFHTHPSVCNPKHTLHEIR